MEGLEVHVLGNYIRNYNENGLAGLQMKPIPGTKRKFSTQQQYKILYVVTSKTPDEVGFEGIKIGQLKL